LIRADQTSGYLLQLLCSATGEQTPLPPGGWRALLQAAEAQGLLWHLAQRQALTVQMRADVKARSLIVMARNLALAGELRSCLRALRAAGVTCATVRGIALLERVYGDIVARPMGDIDLLIQRSEIDAVRQALSRLGYREMDRRPGFAEEFSYSLKFFVERQFTVVVEPHLSIAYPPALERLDMDEVWTRCVSATVIGEPTLSLCPEDLLLHLVLHLAHRDDPPMVWSWELDRVIRLTAEEIDWDLFPKLVRESGVERIVGRVFAGLETSFHTPIPSAVATRLASEEGRESRTLAQAVAEHPGIGEREGLAQLIAVQGCGGRARYLLALLLPTPEFMMRQYGLRNRLALPWAYVRRASRFLWEGIKGAISVTFFGRSY
jgi:hypothetical protein